MNWFEAYAFCIWDGGFLPTEAEWEYAAAGGDQERIYPWSSPASSSDIDLQHANYDCLGDTYPGCFHTDILPVGSQPLGAGLWGHEDMAGNIDEWVLDWGGNHYPKVCNDCYHSMPTSGRAVRGGLRDALRPDPVSRVRQACR